VAVQQDRARRAAGDVEEQDRRAAGQTQHLDAHPRNGLRAGPVVRKRDGGVDVAVRLPVRVEVRRLAGNADVFDQGRDDLGVPFAREELARGGQVECCHLCQAVYCVKQETPRTPRKPLRVAPFALKLFAVLC
jgi:hypothetical protein